MKPIKYCADCGKVISTNCTRCKSCENRHRASLRTKIVTYCVDCGAVIGNRSTRCDKCNRLYVWTMPKYREQHAVQMKAVVTRLWQDPNYVDIMSKAVEKYWESEEHHIIMSERMKSNAAKLWNNPDNRAAASKRMKALNTVMWSDTDYRRHMLDKLDTRWKDPKYRQLMHKHVIAQWADVNGKTRQSTKHFRPSSLEMKFKAMLDDANINYKQQFKPKDYNRIYDFILPEYNILIEIDGMHYHYSDWAIGCGVPNNDAEKDKWAVEHGYILIRIPECDMPADIVTAWLIPEVLQGVDNAL